MQFYKFLPEVTRLSTPPRLVLVVSALRSVALVKKNGLVVGGITYRTFPQQVGAGPFDL